MGPVKLKENSSRKILNYFKTLSEKDQKQEHELTMKNMELRSKQMQTFQETLALIWFHVQVDFVRFERWG